VECLDKKSETLYWCRDPLKILFFDICGHLWDIFLWLFTSSRYEWVVVLWIVDIWCWFLLIILVNCPVFIHFRSSFSYSCLESLLELNHAILESKMSEVLQIAWFEVSVAVSMGSWNLNFVILTMFRIGNVDIWAVFLYIYSAPSIYMYC
jgi:hypothetical protein